MTSDSSVDRNSFQQLLANAFAVQESQIDGQMLSAILEVQRLLTRGELGMDGAMLLIVEAAREVANAAGVAIGLLKGDQLVYRAGSGCSATYIGSRVTASLTASANVRTSREILRVEDAQTDTRIEAAICRQFGAQSLLILPIYHDRALAGVVEVLFSEAHAFQEREVRIYRLMVGLIEAALFQATPLERTENQRAEIPMLAHALVQDTLPTEELYNDNESMLEKGKQAMYRCWEAALAAVRELPVLRHPGLLATKMVQRAREVTWQKPPLSVTLAGVATVLMLAFWITSGGGRGPASPSSLGSSTPSGSIAIEQQETSEPAKVMPVEGTSRTSKVQPGRVSRNEPKLARGRVRRGQVGRNEVEYIGDDVTVRHFRYKPAAQKGRTGASRVAYIGEDVTVRYFTPKQAAKSASR